MLYFVLFLGKVEHYSKVSICIFLRKANYSKVSLMTGFAKKKLVALFKLFFFFFLILFCLSSCISNKKAIGVRTILKEKKCHLAINQIANDKKFYENTSQLLFYLDSAMVNMQCNNYKTSNFFFHKAERKTKTLYTKSVSKNIVSFFSNDYIIPYAGEDFEKVLINLFSALSYAKLGERDEALVECRKLNSLLTLYNSKYKNTKNAYKEDAFARYLSGILYEEDGEFDDAYIDYKKAYEVFLDYNKFYKTKPPNILKEDLLRISMLVEREKETAKILNTNNINLLENNWQEKGKIIFIHFDGLIPAKQERKFIITPKRINILFPEYQHQKKIIYKSFFSIIKKNKEIKVVPELVEDISAIAIRNLSDRKARIWAKIITRATIKQIAIKQVANKNEDKFISDLITNSLNIANNIFLERADIRSWVSLPSKIYISRIFLAPATYDIFFINSNGIKTLKQKSLIIKKGKTKYIIVYTMSPLNN